MENGSRIMFENDPMINTNNSNDLYLGFLKKEEFSFSKYKNRNESHIINFNKNKNNHKSRNPGIDIIRIIAMYGIIITHLLYSDGGALKYFQYYKKLKILYIATGWHINGFALISGVVGYKSYKYSNLLYLWLEVFFYSVFIYSYFKKFKKNYIIDHDISYEFSPIIFSRYWYFTAYFGMYLIIPVINKGISILTKNELRLVVISTLSLFVFWRDFKNPKIDIFFLNKGNSMIWLLIYYLTGAYIGKYRVEYTGIKKYIYCSIYFFIYLFSIYLFYKVDNDELYLGNSNFEKKIQSFLKQIITTRLDSILKVIQSICVCLFFLHINYNKYLAKIICFCGPLVFGIYLVHINSIVNQNILRHIFDNENKYISLYSAMILISLKGLKVFVISIIIDFFRYILFNFLRIKKLCMLLEKKMNVFLGIN